MTIVDGVIDLESKLKLEMQTYLDLKFTQLESRQSEHIPMHIHILYFQEVLSIFG